MTFSKPHHQFLCPFIVHQYKKKRLVCLINFTYIYRYIFFLRKITIYLDKVLNTGSLGFWSCSTLLKMLLEFRGFHPVGFWVPKRFPLLFCNCWLLLLRTVSNIGSGLIFCCCCCCCCCCCSSGILLAEMIRPLPIVLLVDVEKEDGDCCCCCCFWACGGPWLLEGSLVTSSKLCTKWQRGP